jgi:hypothetical protein
LHRIEQGLDAGPDQGCRKLELRILSWRDSLRRIQQGWTLASHTTQNLGNGARIFEMEGLSCEESGQAARAGHARAAGKWSRVFFFFFEKGLSCEESRQGWRALATRRAAERWSFVFFESEELSCENRAGSWCAVSHAWGSQRIGTSYFRDGGTRLRKNPGRAGHEPLQNQESWSFVFSRWRTLLQRIQAGWGAPQRQEQQKVGAYFFLSWRDSLADNPGRAGHLQGDHTGLGKLTSFFRDGGTLAKNPGRLGAFRPVAGES